MTYKTLRTEWKRNLNMVEQSDQKVDLFTRCKLMGEIGYLQGTIKTKMGYCDSEVKKRAYRANLEQLDALVKEVTA